MDLLTTTATNIESDEATVPKQDDDNHVTVNIRLLSNEDTESHSLSLSSTNSNTQNNRDICRICHCEETPDERLISPCRCLGTMKYLHQTCLQRWIKSSGVKSCELCKFEFIMHSEIKPFKHWQKLDMNIVERRKVMCSVAFNLIAIICILWSLLVLIEKTREEVKNGNFLWAFWTKIIVVAIGFTAGLIFLYVQCKMYIQLCIRWRQYNQRIVIHSFSEQGQNQASTTEAKTSSPSSRTDKGIITVLNANDLVPLNSNQSSMTISNEEINDSMLNMSHERSNRNPNRRHHRNLFQKLFNSHRSG